MVRGWGRSPPAYWQQQKVGIECTRTFISSSWRTERLNSFSSPNGTEKPLPPASSSHLCFLRASQFSLYRFPCAIREHRRVKKTPFSTNEGMNFSSEKGTLFLEAAKKTPFIGVCSAPTSPGWLYVQQGQIYFMYTSSPSSSKHKYTQVEHSSPRRLTKQGGVSRLCISHERKPPWTVGALLPGSFSNSTELQNWEQNLDFPSSTHRPGPNHRLNYVKSAFTSPRDFKTGWPPPPFSQYLCISVKQSCSEEVLEITSEWCYWDIKVWFLK